MSCMPWLLCRTNVKCCSIVQGFIGEQHRKESSRQSRNGLTSRDHCSTADRESGEENRNGFRRLSRMPFADPFSDSSRFPISFKKRGSIFRKDQRPGEAAPGAIV